MKRGQKVSLGNPFATDKVVVWLNKITDQSIQEFADRQKKIAKRRELRKKRSLVRVNSNVPPQLPEPSQEDEAEISLENKASFSQESEAENPEISQESEAKISQESEAEISQESEAESPESVLEQAKRIQFYSYQTFLPNFFYLINRLPSAGNY